MCAIFGLMDFTGTRSNRQQNKIINTLARCCEVRGTDATGIAYNTKRQMVVFKRPLPARKMKLRIPGDVSTVMGHTRLATQGSAKRNENNHPFRGEVQGEAVAMAHNGVLWNDQLLRKSENLPATSIETDSFIAMQLLEKRGDLSFDSLAWVAEQVNGSFTFTFLDRSDSLYIIKGSSPVAIYRFDGFLLYASTDEILQNVVARLRLGRYEEIHMREGDILKIAKDGSLAWGQFSHSDYDYFRGCYDWGWDLPKADDAFDTLVDAAKMFGFTEEEVRLLLEFGLDADEIAELLYTPEYLYTLLDDIRHEYHALAWNRNDR